MKKFIIIFSLIMPNMSFAEILDKFSLACICDKNINALKYFDCKQKVSGTQLDLLKDESNKDKILINVSRGPVVDNNSLKICLLYTSDAADE